MSSTIGPFELLRPDSPAMAERGIACLMAGPEGPYRGSARETQARMSGFLEYCRRTQVDLSRQVCAFKDGAMVTSCLWVPSKGRTAAIYAADLQEFPQAAGGVAICLRAAAEEARAAGAVLAQSTTTCGDVAAPPVLATAGYSFLAALAYMRRPQSRLGRALRRPPLDEVSEYRWMTWRPGDDRLFQDVIKETYINTLDCPRLAGVRRIEDVLAGHRAVGQFEPRLWRMLFRSDEPVGVVLMARMPERRELEVVYLGVTPQARGVGCGMVLIGSAIIEMARSNMKALSLAVDEANYPAMRLYENAGFEKTGERRVFIKVLEPPPADQSSKAPIGNSQTDA